MGFLDDLAELVENREIRRLALRRARSRELAEDALQETYRAVAQTRNPEAIEDLRKFFCKSLIRTIGRQYSATAPTPAEDIDAIADSCQNSNTSSSDAVEDVVHLRILAEIAFTRFERDRGGLMSLIPGRSHNPHRYQCAILTAAGTIFYLLLRGPVTTADWNSALRSAYPQWCDEPGLPSDTAYQRLSRARADVQCLLRVILPRDRFAS